MATIEQSIEVIAPIRAVYNQWTQFEEYPRFLEVIAEILPLTHFLRLIRAIMLRGAGIAEMWTSLAALGVMIAVMLGVAVSRVHKRLD